MIHIMIDFKYIGVNILIRPLKIIEIKISTHYRATRQIIIELTSDQ
jgi:hypothetical protein